MSRAPLYGSLAAVIVLTVTPVIAYRGDRPAATGRSVIIVTPHNEQIRWEFSNAFARWHEREYGERVEIAWSTPGGTSEIRQMLVAQYETALRQGVPVGGDADIMFGGGSYEFDALSRPLSVGSESQPRTTTVLQSNDWITPEQLAAIYGENAIDGRSLYDPKFRWFGCALSTFGIVSNTKQLSLHHIEPPRTWADLADPRLFERVALVNPAQSGSVATAFETILQRLGWRRGWQVLRRAAANSNQIVASSSVVPTTVGKGESWTGIAIDFYGRYQVQALADSAVSTSIQSIDRLEFTTPQGESVVDADPVAILTGAPNLELAKHFVLFCLSMEAQVLWQLPHGDTQLCGYQTPARYSLRRMPVRRGAYECCESCFVDKINPFDDQSPLVSNPDFRDFVSPLFVPLAISNTDLLRRAWLAIHTHPAYSSAATTADGIVSAEDVTDPQLKQWLEMFDDLPVLAGPKGQSFDLDDTAVLSVVRKGWIKGGFAADGLWVQPQQPRTVMRRQFNEFFRNQYQRIVDAAESAAPAR